jgi:type I restriction enzyme S subunit
MGSTNQLIPWENEYPTSWNILRGKSLFYSKKVLNKENKCSNILSLTLNGVIKNNVDNPIGLAPKDYDTYQLFYKDDLVFKLIDLVNISTSRVGLVPEIGAMSPAYIRLCRRTNEINVKYFYWQYYSWWLRNIYNGLGAGVRQTLSATDLLDLYLLVPSVEEQNKIVDFLNWKTSEINHFIRMKKKEIKSLEEYKVAKINHLITKGLEENISMMKSGVDWIGDVPAHWSINMIKQHFSIKKRIAGKEGYNILSITQLGLKVKDISTNEGQMAQNYANYQFVNPGDFAMNHMDLITGYVDLSRYFGVTSPDYRVFVVDDTENCYAPYYLRVFQIGYKRRVFYKFGKGAANQGRWRLPKQAFLNYQIPVPSYDEQIAIANMCERVEQEIGDFIEKLQKEIILVEELRTKIISDAVTGKIDVRGVKIPEYQFETDELDIETIDEENINESNIEE